MYILFTTVTVFKQRDALHFFRYAGAPTRQHQLLVNILIIPDCQQSLTWQSQDVATIPDRRQLVTWQSHYFCCLRRAWKRSWPRTWLIACMTTLGPMLCLFIAYAETTNSSRAQCRTKTSQFASIIQRHQLTYTYMYMHRHVGTTMHHRLVIATCTCTCK